MIDYSEALINLRRNANLAEDLTINKKDFDGAVAAADEAVDNALALHAALKLLRLTQKAAA